MFDSNSPYTYNIFANAEHALRSVSDDQINTTALAVTPLFAIILCRPRIVRPDSALAPDLGRLTIRGFVFGTKEKDRTCNLGGFVRPFERLSRLRLRPGGFSMSYCSNVRFPCQTRIPVCSICHYFCGNGSLLLGTGWFGIGRTTPPMGGAL